MPRTTPGAARHDARAEQGALLAAGNSRSDEVQAALAQRCFPTLGVDEVRVAGIDDDVAVLEQRTSSSMTASVPGLP